MNSMKFLLTFAVMFLALPLATEAATCTPSSMATVGGVSANYYVVANVFNNHAVGVPANAVLDVKIPVNTLGSTYFTGNFAVGFCDATLSQMTYIIGNSLNPNSIGLGYSNANQIDVLFTTPATPNFLPANTGTQQSNSIVVYFWTSKNILYPTANVFLSGHLTASYGANDIPQGNLPQGVVAFADWVGVSNPSGWTSSGGSINNGYSTGGYANTIITYPTSQNTLAVDLFATFSASNAQNGEMGFSTDFSATNQQVAWEAGCSSTVVDANPIGVSNGGCQAPSPLVPAKQWFYIYSAWWDGTNKLSNYTINYTSSYKYFTTAADIPAVSLFAGLDCQGSCTATVYWAMVRVSQPNGYEPVVSWGTVKAGVSVSITISPTSVVYPHTSLATASCSPNTDTCQVWQSSGFQSLCSGTGSCAYTIPINAVATYSFYANDITAAVASSSSNFIVTANAIIETCNRNSQAITFGNTYNSVSANELTQCAFASYNNQVTSGNVFKNGNAETLGGNFISVRNTWSGGLDVYIANVLSSPNYTSNTQTWSVNSQAFNVVNTIFNSTAWETTTQGFDWQLNLTKYGTTANVLFQLNGNVLVSLTNVPINQIAPQWFNFSANILTLSGNNINWYANVIGNMLLRNSIVFNSGVMNTLIQTEKQAFPQITYNSAFVGVSNPVTANSVVPYAYNHNINLYRNAVLLTNGQNIAQTNSQSWSVATWQINATDTVSTRTSSANVVIYQVALGFPCGSVPAPYYTAGNVAADNGITSNVLRILISDENSLSHIANLSNATGFINMFGTSFNGLALGFSNTLNQNTATFCISMVSGVGQTANATGQFFYSTSNTYLNGNGITRQYIFNKTQLTANVLKTLTLYTMNSVPNGMFTGNFNFFVTGSNLQQLAADVQVFRFYPSTNSFKLVDFIQASPTATTQATLQSGQYYNFNIYNLSLSLLGVLPLTQLNCVTLAGCNIQLPLPSNITTLFNYTNQIVHTCVFSNSTLTLTCSVADATSSTTSYVLNVTLHGVLANTPQCLVKLNSPNGQLVCALPNNSSTYSYTLIANEGAKSYLIASGAIGGLIKGVFGNTGYIAAFLLIISLSFLGVWHPVAMGAFDLFGIMMVMLMNLATLSVPLIINLVIVIVIQAWKMR